MCIITGDRLAIISYLASFTKINTIVAQIKKGFLSANQNLRQVCNDSFLSFNYNFQGNIRVSVFQGIKNSDDYKLNKFFKETITFDQKKPQIRALSSGTIFPNSKDLKFNFEAVNVKEVTVRIIKIYEDNVNVSLY